MKSKGFYGFKIVMAGVIGVSTLILLFKSFSYEEGTILFDAYNLMIVAVLIWMMANLNPIKSWLKYQEIQNETSK